ncbi:PHP domain-containing protein [Oscillochloris sp. ZM17-4]|uniref:CehA/McbA family metallohydrolase n=1 Tax=Oscillochloris sp. ZM17-4 TaxID=2866714 RepID=UPI001C73415A|nr:PHP domain-containing protein [Oscillochloris sp. ZM17-4]MBX0329958.1 PHP domain-containing protein [Oscillochloris sp. ZM17-4]
MRTMFSTADIHIHTTYSDGVATPAQVLAYVAAHTDLRVIAITDHDVIGGALEARDLAGEFGVEVIVGEEVSTREGHLLALFIEEELPAGRPAAETVAAIHAQGGICVAPHPFGMLVPSVGRHGLLRRASGLERGWPVDAIEAFNASLWLPLNNGAAARYAAHRALPALGGSDAHHLETIGMGYTRFPGRGVADLRRAILAGETVACGRRWFWGPRLLTAWLAARLGGAPDLPVAA